MKKIKKTLVLLMVLMLVVPSLEIQAKSRKMKIIIDYENVKLKEEPIVKNNRTFVPVREISEKLGMDVSWNQKEQYAKVVDGDKVIKLPLGKRYAYVNGVKKILDSPVFAKGGRTFLPLRFILEEMGFFVHWDQEAYSVVIDSEIFYLDSIEYLHSNNMCVNRSPSIEPIGESILGETRHTPCEVCITEYGDLSKVTKEIIDSIDMDFNYIDNGRGRIKIDTTYTNNSKYPILTYSLTFSANGQTNHLTSLDTVLPGEKSFNFYVDGIKPEDLSNTKDLYITINYLLPNSKRVKAIYDCQLDRYVRIEISHYH